MDAIATDLPPDFTKEGLYFLPLGGAGEIGMNLNLYRYQGKWLMVDLGITFGNEGQTPGVDVILPDPGFIEERRDDLVGLVITHGHEDHLGAVPYLWPWLSCPVYASPFTAEFLRRKLREEDLQDEVPIHEIPLQGRFSIGPFDLQLITTTHSIPEPNHLAIRTEAGTILHTADWKLDPEPLVGAPADLDGLKRLGEEGVLAMVGDSTNIFTKGSAGSEGEVRRSLAALFGQFDRRIAVACFASNIARMESIALAAQANGREVALVGRSLWRMHDTAKACGYLQDAPPFLKDEEGAYLPPDKVVYICTGSQGEPRAALKRIASDSHPHVVLDPGDVVVFSSRVIPGNERSVYEVQNQLAANGVKLVTNKDAFVHVSGHPGAEEVRTLYDLVRPQISIPVHGERMHLEEHAKEARTLGVAHVLTNLNGQVARLDGPEPGVVGQVSTGRLALDGDRLIPMDNGVVRERRKVSRNGIVVVSLVVDGRGTLLADPQLTLRGVTDPDEDQEEIDALLLAINHALDRAAPRDLRKDERLAEVARLAVRRALRSQTGLRPMIDVHVIRI